MKKYITNKLKSCLILIMLLSSIITTGQNINPIIRPDTITCYIEPKATQYNVLANDYDADGDRIRVTSVKYKTSYKTPGTKITVDGVGILSIDSLGNLAFNVAAKDTIIFLDFGYVANDGKMKSGISAKIILRIVKRPVIITSDYQDTLSSNYGMRIWKDPLKVIHIWQGDFNTTATLRVIEIYPGRLVYYLICDDEYTIMYQIPEEIGKLLM